MFNAIVIEKEPHYHARLATLSEADLPKGEVLVRVEYSTLNYKDALAITGKSPVVRQFPMVAGIDFAGTVIASQSPEFQEGDKVLLNGWGVGEKHWGGLAEKACVPANWLIPLPAPLTCQQAMAIGTAGYTAMLCVQALQKQGIQPDKGKILVTGANGGVGSFAIAILAHLGYHVVASTGRPSETAYLQALGAKEIIHRETLSAPAKPLMKEQWIGAIDSVGSHTLANVCASLQYGGVAVACGLAQGMDFPATVAPFILRGITLVGVDSVMCQKNDRLLAWQQLANMADALHLPQISHEIPLNDAINTATALLKGDIQGRVVVKIP
ncbi:alcohol dehydrogenase [Pasteurellaceae bacterium Macca]|nr:alcohol dehydrogenase [Pasteurellaceae bacterium Macca]